MPLPFCYESLNDLISSYDNRIEQEIRNMNRVKKFYNDEESFDMLMLRITDKDDKRFEKFISNTNKLNGGNSIPNPWRILYIILDIVQYEGKEIAPFDVLTRDHSSRNMIYYGWTFSWVHGENTLISIYNRKDELVYRF